MAKRYHTIDHNCSLRESPIFYEPLSDSFAGSLRQLLPGSVRETDPSIERPATLCDCSKRTPERQLREMNTQYAEVLGLARYDVARRMRQVPSSTVHFSPVGIVEECIQLFVVASSADVGW